MSSYLDINNLITSFQIKNTAAGHQDSFATPSAGTDPAQESSESLPVGAPEPLSGKLSVHKDVRAPTVVFAGYF